MCTAFTTDAHHRGHPGVRTDEVGHRRIRYQPASPNDHKVVSGLRHLRQQVRGDQNRAPLFSQCAQQLTHPANPFRVKTIDRLIQNEVFRVAQQCGGNAEALAHAEGEPADLFARHLTQAHQG